MLSITTTVNVPGLSRISPELMRHAQTQLSERWRHVCEPYVPKRTGSLRDEVSIEGDAITYNVDYAAYVYHMANASFTEPGTGGFWDERAKAEHLDEVVDFVRDVIVGGTG